MESGQKAEETQEQFVERLLLESAFACHRERIPNACEQLGNLLTTFKKDYDGAREVHKKNCDELNFSRSCFAYAQLVDNEQFKAVDNKVATDYFTRACDTGHSRGCLSAAKRYADPRSSQKDYDKAMEVLKKGCDIFEPKCCTNVSEFYRQGKIVPKDMTQALKYAERACEFGSIPGCVNAHIMYKKGDGVEQSDEKAQKFKDMGKDHMKRELEKQRILHDPSYRHNYQEIIINPQK